jgi:tetratricopeptide (TPR) repeat protein
VVRRVWLLSGLLALVTVGAGAWAIRAGVHHDLYAAIFIPVVAHRAAGNAAGPDEITARLEQFVYANVRSLSDMPEKSHDAQLVLLRGFGYCDQNVFAFIHLLQEKEVSGAMTFLYDAKGVSPHTVAEVMLDGKWRVFDTLFGFTPRRADGALATVREVAGNPALLAGSRASSEWYRDARVQILRGPERWKRGMPRLTYLRQAGIRRLVAVTPAWAIDALQDAYLRLPPPPPSDHRFIRDTPEYRLFYRARNYHVFRRGEAAAGAYAALLRDYPGSDLADDALYELGRLRLLELGDAPGALSALETLLAAHPRTPWADDATYFAARARETLGDCAGAARLYREVAEGQSNGMEDARARLARLACR